MYSSSFRTNSFSSFYVCILIIQEDENTLAIPLQGNVSTLKNDNSHRYSLYN